MPEYERRIREIRAVHDEARADLESALRVAGAACAQLDAADRPATTAALVDRVVELNEYVRATGEEVQRLLELDARQRELRDRLRTLQDERDHLRLGLEPTYQRIGEAGYRLFRERPISDPAFVDVFDRLAAHHDRLKSLGRELETRRRELGDDSGVRTLIPRARLASMRRKHAALERQLTRLYQDAGRDLVRQGFGDRIDNEAFTATFDPLREVEQRETEIDREIARLAEESGNLVTAFNAIAGEQKLARARAAREAGISEARRDLNDVLQSLGEMVETDTPLQLREQAEAIDAARRRANHFETLLHRLEAGRQVVELDRDLDRVSARLEDVTSQVATLQARLKELQTTRERTQRERDRLLEERGEERELFSE